MNELRIGMRAIGPHTACVLLSLWAEGKIDISLIEFRSLVKLLSGFLEELEEIRETNFMQRR